MATSMEADSEVHFKERQEGKGVKTETPGTSVNAGGVALGTRGRAQRRGRRGTPQDRAEEIQPAAGEV